MVVRMSAWPTSFLDCTYVDAVPEELGGECVSKCVTDWMSPMTEPGAPAAAHQGGRPAPLLLQLLLQTSGLFCHTKTPQAVRPYGASTYKVGLGRFELPTSRLSDTRLAMVGDGERWKQGVLADFAMVSDGQRW